MSDVGWVENVKVEPVGSEFASPAIVGATVITLHDVEPFSEIEGGMVQIMGVTYPYLSVSPGEGEDDASTMTLATGLLTAVDLTEDAVKAYMYPLAEEKLALVNMPSAEDANWMRIRGGLEAQFVEGLREVFEQETVICDIDERGWVVVDVSAETPRIQGRYIATDEGPVGGDDTPPAGAAIFTVIGGLGIVFVRITEAVLNSSVVDYEYHVVPDDVTIPTPGDSATVVHRGPETSFTIRTLPSGAKLPYGLPVYVRVFAHDEDGYGPISAVGSATPMQITGPDVAADYVYANNIIADQITGGTMSADVVVSGSFWTALTGQRAGMTGAGFFAYNPAGKAIFSVPTNPTDEVPISLDAEVNARNLTVEGDIEIRGAGMFAPGSVTRLANKTSAPTSPPSATPGFPTRNGGLPYYLNTTSGWSVGANDEYHAGAFYDSSLITKRARDSAVAGVGVQVGPNGWDGNPGPGTDGIHTNSASTFSPQIVFGGIVERWNAANTSTYLVTLGQSAGGNSSMFARRYLASSWPLRDDATRHDCQQQWAVPLSNWWFGAKIGPSDTRNHIAVAQAVENGGAWNRLSVRIYDWETGLQVGSTMTTGVIDTMTGNEQLRFVKSVAVGKFGIDATTRYAIGLYDRLWFFTASGTTLTFDAAYNFYAGHSNVDQWAEAKQDRTAGGTYGGFKSVKHLPDIVTTEIVDYTEQGKAGSVNGTTHYVANTWAKHSINPTGFDFETSSSATKQVTWPKRGHILMSVPKIPIVSGDANPPDSVAFYVGSASPSTRLNRWLPAELPIGATQQTIKSITLSGVQAPSASNFPNGIAAQIASNAMDTSGSPAPLTYMDGDGKFWAKKMTQSGRQTVTPTANVVTAVPITFVVPFDAAPVVQVTPDSSVIGTTVVAWGAQNITANGFDLSILATNGSARALQWTAFAKTQ